VETTGEGEGEGGNSGVAHFPGNTCGAVEASGEPVHVTLGTRTDIEIGGQCGDATHTAELIWQVPSSGQYIFFTNGDATQNIAYVNLFGLTCGPGGDLCLVANERSPPQTLRAGDFVSIQLGKKSQAGGIGMNIERAP
jgi:hypothetical protein